MQILIYQDYIHNNGVLLRRLAQSFGHNAIRLIDARDIIGGALDMADILVMPGGADLYYCEKLNGAGNAAIKSFVENGGVYFGICAGAYYASNTLEWGKNTAQEITGSRELGFFSGICTGPIYDFIEDGAIEKSWKAVIPVSFNGKTEHVFYEGGGIFTAGHNEKILARYETLPDNPAAIIACAVENGLAILSSPHIEYTAADAAQTIYRHRNPSYAYNSTLPLKSLPERGELWHMICDIMTQHIKTINQSTTGQL